jgi:hypothetical protein
MKITVSISRQTLELVDHAGVCQRRYPVSTAVRGAGQQEGSYCTPLGSHRIRAKIGAMAPLGAVFRGRRPSGEIHDPVLAAAQPDRDWILTRILWLCGNQPGFNRGGDVDTMRRLIYIHGTPDAASLGYPKSHGCIRMGNRDVAELFDLVPPGTEVEISE